MSTSYAAYSKVESKETSFASVLFFSLVFHVFIFLIIPIATRILWHPKTFERPQTFQLVRMPPKTVPVKQRGIDRPKEKKKAVPKKPVPKTKKDSRPAQKKEEIIDKELEDILGGLVQPISSISPIAGFKYDWYLRSVEDKVKRYWSPSVNDPNISVDLEFTIYNNGEISDIKAKRSSGNSSLDNLALRAVKLAAPFGKLPPRWKGELPIALQLVAAKE